MLTKQFFTRVQLAKLLGFKSDSLLKEFDKKEFLVPQIKPSKYSLNQVLFTFICKELVQFTNLSWKHLVNSSFNQIALNNLLENNLLIIINYIDSDTILVSLKNDDNYVKQLEKCLDFDILNTVSNVDGRENTTFYDIPALLITPDGNRQIMTISINRIYRKLQYKSNELKIDLEEKVTA